MPEPIDSLEDQIAATLGWIFDVGAAAKYLKVTPRYVRTAAASGDLVVIQPKKRGAIRIRARRLAEWLLREEEK